MSESKEIVPADQTNFQPVPLVEAERIEDLLAIDEEHLDYEWQRQPELHAMCTRLAARSRAAVGLMRNQAKAAAALLNMEFRRNGIPGLSKVTDEGIKAAVAADLRVQDYENKLAILVALDVEIEGLVRRCEQRISSLKWLSTFRGFKPPKDEVGETPAYVSAATAYANERLTPQHGGSE